MQERDTFGLINRDTCATLIQNAKYLKHVPTSCSAIVKELESSDEALGSSNKGLTKPDACNSNEPAGHCCYKQASQNESNATTTRSG